IRENDPWIVGARRTLADRIGARTGQQRRDVGHLEGRGIRRRQLGEHFEGVAITNAAVFAMIALAAASTAAAARCSHRTRFALGIAHREIYPARSRPLARVTAPRVAVAVHTAAPLA